MYVKMFQTQNIVIIKIFYLSKVTKYTFKKTVRNVNRTEMKFDFKTSSSYFKGLLYTIFLTL